MTGIVSRNLSAAAPTNVTWFARFMHFVFGAVILLYFVLPPNLLQIIGWNYLGGGLELEKIHIATYLLIVAFALIVAVDPHFRDRVASLLFGDAVLIAFVTMIAATTSFAVLTKSVSLAPFLDTFLASLLVAVGTISIPARSLRQFRVLLDVYFVASIVILFFEYATRSRVIPSSSYEMYAFGLFRASALFENTLGAAALLGVYSLVLLVSMQVNFTWSCIIRLCMSFSALAAILTTGGRASLITACALVLAFLAFSALRQARIGQLNAAGMAYVVVAVPALLVIVVFMLQLGIFDTILARFENDVGSATTREIALNLLSRMSLDELWLGMSARDVAGLAGQQEVLGIIAIEISWVNFILVCGLIFTIPLFVTYVLFLFVFLPRYCDQGVYFPAIFLLVITAASNGIWSKTTILSASFAVIISFLRQDVVAVQFGDTRAQTPTTIGGH